MATFERYFAQESQKVPRLPTADARRMAGTGGALEAQGIKQLGEGLTEVSEVLFKWHEREGNTQFDTARGSAQDAFGKFQRTDFNNSNEHDKAYELLKKSLEKLAPVNTSGAKKYTSWLELNNESITKAGDEKKIRMIKKNNQVAYFENMANLATQTDRTVFYHELKLLTKGAVDDNTRTPDQASSDYDRAVTGWAKRLLERTVANIVQEAGWEGAEKFLHDKGAVVNLVKEYGLEFQDIDAEIENIQTQLKYETQKAEKARQNRYEETEKEAYNRLQDGSLTVGWINAQFNTGFLSKADRDVYRKEMAGVKTKTNWPEYDKVVTIIDGVASGKNTGEQARQAIAEGVGKYFDTGAAKSLRTKLSTNLKAGSPTQRPAHVRAITEIEEVMDARIKLAGEEEDYGLKEEMFDLHTKNKLKNDLDAYAQAEERTDEDIEKKVKSLLRLQRERIVLGFLDKLLLPKDKEQLKLSLLRYKALEKEAVFKTLTDEEKRSARRRFERGETLDEVLELLGD